MDGSFNLVLIMVGVVREDLCMPTPDFNCSLPFSCGSPAPWLQRVGRIALHRTYALGCSKRRPFAITCFISSSTELMLHFHFKFDRLYHFRRVFLHPCTQVQGYWYTTGTHVPYSGNLSQVKTFANCWKLDFHNLKFCETTNEIELAQTRWVG